MFKTTAVILCLMLAVVPAQAVELDYASYSTDDLLEIRKDVDEELYSRFSEDRFPADAFKVYAGDYVVGVAKDERINMSIGNEGYYLLTSVGPFTAFIRKFSNVESWDLDFTKPISTHDAFVDYPTLIHLVEGEVVEVSRGSIMLQPIAKPAYMP